MSQEKIKSEKITICTAKSKCDYQQINNGRIKCYHQRYCDFQSLRDSRVSEIPNDTLEDLCKEIIRLKKMKPMSRERLSHIINLKVSDLTIKRRIFDLRAQEELADAILAEWGKG